MRWQGGRQSGNVDDRRGVSGGQVAVGGGILGLIALVLNFLNGGEVDPSQLPQIGGSRQTSGQMSAQEAAADDERGQFVKTVLAYTEDVWNDIFQKSGQNYPEPTLVLFRDGVQSGCGNATAASGPFYCPADQRLYIDLSFYSDLQNKFGAPGDFAMAYVVAHEVGHHIQTLMGTSEKMARMRGQVSKAEYNAYSVKMELQADFLAGVWAHYMKGKNILEEGDIEEALNAAKAIGDDRLTGGRVSKESFTHGTSAQRMYWFKKGYTTGDINQGDTFSNVEVE
jgi:predicted metalloprotease